MNSTQQLLVLFRDYYKVPLTKKTKSGDALDSDVLKKIGKKLDAANVLLEYKVLKKLVSTYLDSLVEKIDADGKLHTEFKLWGTTTGRLASANPNCQNLPAEVKYMFVPPSKDYVCVNVDQSAAELHVLSALAQDRKMIACFEEHRDLHRETASAVFNKKPEDITDQERKIAKRCFSADSFILTEDGYIRGKDIGNRKVYTLDGKLQNQHHVYEEREGLKLTLRCGHSITVTNDHKLQDFSHVVPTWKTADCFKVGDILGFRKVVPEQRNTIYLDNNMPIDKWHRKKCPNKIELDEALAYLMGVYLGDGCMQFDHRKHQASQIKFVLKSKSKDYVLNTIGRIHNFTKVLETEKYGVYTLTCKEMAYLFYEHMGCTRNKHVPDVMFRAPRDIVLAFLAGIIDSDGSTAGNRIVLTNTNDRLISDISRLSLLYGYTTTLTKQTTSVGKYRLVAGRQVKSNYPTLFCTYVHRPILPLKNVNKLTNLLHKVYENRTNKWEIHDTELACLHLSGKGRKIQKSLFRGELHSITDSSAHVLDIPHKNYWAQEIVKIEPVRFEALIMETDTHFFIGEGLDSRNCNFGVSYGVSGKGLKELLEPEGVKITDKQGDKFIKKWRDTYPGCARYLDNASKNFNRYGYLETPFGRRRHKYKNYMSQEKEAAASRQAGNFLIQSTASDIQVYEMVHMYKTLVDNGVLPVFTVHDSIVMYCPINKLEWLRDYYKQETCRRFPQLNNLLMYTEMEVGRNYGEHVKLPYDCDFDEWRKTNAFLFEETSEDK